MIQPEITSMEVFAKDLMTFNNLHKDKILKYRLTVRRISTLNTHAKPSFQGFSIVPVLCWCVFKLITCNGSPLCRKWSLNSNPDRF